MQTLTKRIIVVTVLVVSIAAFCANVAYAQDLTLTQIDSSASTPDMFFGLPNTGVLTGISIHCYNPTPFTTLGSVVVTETYAPGSPTPTFSLVPIQSGPNDVVYSANETGVPVAPGTTVSIVYDGDGTPFPSGSTCSGAVTAATGPTGPVTGLWGKSKNFNKPLPAGTVPLVVSATGLQSGAYTFVPSATESALLVHLEVGCDSPSPAAAYPMLQTTVTTSGAAATFSASPIVSPALNQAVWSMNPLPPGDAGAAVTTALTGTIPVGSSCYISAFGFLASQASADSLYIGGLTGGLAPPGLTIQVATNTANSVSLTIPPVSNSQLLVISNAGCVNPTGAPAGPTEVSITSGGSASLWSVVANQTAANPDNVTYGSGPLGNPADPGSTIILYGTGLGAGSSCVTTGVSLTGTKSAISSASLDVLEQITGPSSSYGQAQSAW